MCCSALVLHGRHILQQRRPGYFSSEQKQSERVCYVVVQTSRQSEELTPIEIVEEYLEAEETDDAVVEEACVL
jgi:hypothetical protein